MTTDYNWFNNEKSGGAWCPHTQLSTDNSGQEWIEVYLPDQHIVTGVATQGRYGNGYGVEFVEEYWIEYSRDNGTNWIKWKATDGQHLLEGNVDTLSVVEHDLDLPIVDINRIRLYPYSKHLRTVCLRFELYGCLYDGPVSYSMAQGEKTSRFGDLMDKTYDGHRSQSGQLNDGLGQLVDGIKGLDNYKINKGFEWIGWQKSINKDNVEIVFDFPSVHNFTTTSINCHNSFSRDVRVFSSAQIWFSIDGIKWSTVPIKYTYQADNTLQRPRDVIIHLQYRIGRYVKMSLTFGAQWLHISEISFDSQSLFNTSANISELFDFEDNLGLISNFSVNNNSLSPMATQDFDQTTMKFSLLIITLVTLGVVVLMVVSSFMMKAYQSRKGGVFREISDTDIESENQTVNLKDIPKITSPQTLLYCEPKDLSPTEEEAEYAVPDVICANGKSKTLSMTSNKTIKTNPRYYASAEIIKKHNISDNNYSKHQQQQPILNHYESANYSSQQTPLLTTFMSNNHVRNGSSTTADAINQIKCFHPNDVFVFEKIGNSRFGDVLYAKVDGIYQNKDNAIVKSLNHLHLKQEFMDEMRLLCQLSQNCDKFAKMFGVLDTSDCLAMILEQGDCDLNEFLRECDPSVITYGTLVYMASEIAKGCNYLETLGRTHRDLSARNIIFFAKNLMVKISDSGACRDKYRADYVNGMPVRWMSPESIIDGQFTIKSDVYSFSTTLWEILTYCKSRPHYELSDQQLLTIIINNSTEPNEDSLILARPHHCPKEIYDLMVECWHTNEDRRPPFHEICLFLQRKNLGYQKPVPDH
ncbi:discoidin domain-containing receptor 2-like isoform X2 [Oppia nitens]|uniref:discoidin domain-containing receptor 2-like isoform X2 n=1 Tax=Oppia nitens TaxID=1686743 RepID=UPI0023DCC99F|nr:discoidin domain-containing receptor 2-like isoform X2 [Oppia nitens]